MLTVCDRIQFLDRKEEGKTMKSKDLSLAILFAATYYVITLVIAPIAFLQIQCRVSDALYALLPLYGWPLCLGITVANFAGNLSSPLGLLDLITPFICVVPQILVWKFGQKMQFVLIGAIAVWVAFMLYWVYDLPLLSSILSVGVGEAIAVIGIGFPLYYAIKKRFFA